MGFIIRYNGRLKWQAVYFGVPMTILGVSLMINFRQPDVNIGYIVMCQIFIAFGGGTLVICEQMTVQAVSKHQEIPALLAVEGLVASVGGSIGLSIASAMWQGIFPKKLARYLPADAQPRLADIYGSIDIQSSYPLGSDTRNAINRAYGDTQRLMLIASTCLYSITWVSTLFWCRKLANSYGGCAWGIRRLSASDREQVYFANKEEFYHIDSHCDAAFSMISRPTNTESDTLRGLTEETIEAP